MDIAEHFAVIWRRKWRVLLLSLVIAGGVYGYSRTLPKTYKGKHLPHPKAEVLRGSVVEVDSRQPLPIELDGEQPGTTPVRFEVVPRALRLRVP